jgi:pre-mRNA-splicing factor ATP-dependent RNA helicase DHX38/PRP16
MILILAIIKVILLKINQKKVEFCQGGGFDEITGEYIDHDHEQSNYNDLLTIPLESHFYVPPFLATAKEFLQFQIEGGTNIRSIGATVNPVKDSGSELAITAKKGSFVVQDKKSKKERAKRMQDSIGIAGTSIGNAIGVNEEDSAKRTSNSNEIEVSTTPKITIQEQRRTLPAYAERENLVRTIMENQVTIVIGETGSGKTTQLAQFLYEEGLGSNIATTGIRNMIACTQPRRVAAMSVAKRVSEEMDVKLGDEVGYTIRFEDRTNPKKTIIKYMTEGILLRELLTDPLLENYLCVIMDEAHERSLNTDILLGLFKELIRKRKDLKLIVTSATMNADRFTRFFGEAPQFTIPGRTFPVDVLYSKSMSSDYVESAVKQILTIHLQNSQNGNDGDILVFMTGQEDIEMTGEILQEKLELLDNPPPLDIIPIYSSMPADLQKKIFNKKNDSRRKVVIATNIAETSLTVDGVKYVIDSGLVKMKVYNPKLGMDALQVIPISLANAQQRSGRAGRTGPGIAYRLYTERATEKDQMYLQPIPEIQRTNLSNIMLLLKSLGVNDINAFSFLDPPPQDLLNCSLYDLWAIGALNNFGQLTDLGKWMAIFPMEPTLAKTIILSCRPEFSCSEDIVTIVAMLSVPPVYYRPKERQKEADMIREKFYVNESDHLTLLNIYNQWEQNLNRFKKNYNKINSWCNSNFLQLKSLLRAKDIKIQLELLLKKHKFKITRAKDDEDIKKCLCASFFQQLAKLTKINIHGSPEFMNLRHKYMKMHLHPTLCLNGSNLTSPYVIYHELVLTKKEYMNYVTCIQPTWLLEFGYVYYNIPDQYYDKYRDKIPYNIITKSQFLKSIEEDTIKYQQLQISRTFKRKKVQKDNKKFIRRAF